MEIQMVDLKSQYRRIEAEIDEAVKEVLNSTAFINGPQVQTFCGHLADYLQVSCVIPCGNGTDALRLALQAWDIQAGDEVILPAFTYIAAAEMIAALGITPILVDVCPDSFNLNVERLEQAITRQTKAIVVVHLFGQTCDMEPVYFLRRNGKKSRHDRTYRYNILLPDQTAGVLRRRRCRHHFRRTIGGTRPDARQSWPKSKVSSSHRRMQLASRHVAGGCLRRQAAPSE